MHLQLEFKLLCVVFTLTYFFQALLRFFQFQCRRLEKKIAEANASYEEERRKTEQAKSTVICHLAFFNINVRV